MSCCSTGSRKAVWRVCEDDLYGIKWCLVRVWEPGIQSTLLKRRSGDQIKLDWMWPNHLKVRPSQIGLSPHWAWRGAEPLRGVLSIIPLTPVSSIYLHLVTQSKKERFHCATKWEIPHRQLKEPLARSFKLLSTCVNAGTEGGNNRTITPHRETEPLCHYKTKSMVTGSLAWRRNSHKSWVYLWRQSEQPVTPKLNKAVKHGQLQNHLNVFKACGLWNHLISEHGPNTSME